MIVSLTTTWIKDLDFLLLYYFANLVLFNLSLFIFDDYANNNMIQLRNQ